MAGVTLLLPEQIRLTVDLSRPSADAALVRLPEKTTSTNWENMVDMVATDAATRGDMVSTRGASAAITILSQPMRTPLPMLDPRLQELADTLDRLIRASGLTNTYIAEKVGVDKSVVGRWMSGERTPTLENLVNLARLLNVEMTELWDGPVGMPMTPEQRMMVEYMKTQSVTRQQAMVAFYAPELNDDGQPKGD